MMRRSITRPKTMLLIDSHALAWFASGDRRVSKAAREALTDPAKEVFVSVVTYWELEVKRLRSPDFVLPEPVPAYMQRARFSQLNLEFDVPSRIAQLPIIHGDPFDRLLVAQAVHHGLTLVTNDRMIRRYPVETLW
jgi:PIN domain nuclease of toxin-antitoxin system